MLKHLLFLSVFLLSAYFAHAQNSSGFAPHWRSCEQDAQCISVKGSCGEWQAIARSSQQLAADYYASSAAVVECTEFSEKPEPNIACLNQQCTIKQ